MSHLTTLGGREASGKSPTLPPYLPRYCREVSASASTAIEARLKAASRRLLLSSNTSVPYVMAGYSSGWSRPYEIYPVGQSTGKDRGSISYCRATWTANRARATLPIVAYFGLTPAIPDKRKYVWRRSNLCDRTRAIIEAAALISPSPNVTWHTRKSSAQKTCGNSMERPGSGTECAVRLPRFDSGNRLYQTCASGAHCAAVSHGTVNLRDLSIWDKNTMETITTRGAILPVTVWESARGSPNDGSKRAREQTKRILSGKGVPTASCHG